MAPNKKRRKKKRKEKERERRVIKLGFDVVDNVSTKESRVPQLERR